MKPPFITILPDDEAEIRSGILGQRLRQYNYGFAGDYRPAQLIRLNAVDAEGNLLGGLRARVALDWLIIDLLFVDEGLRKAGLGARILREAERIAKVDMGAHSAKLETFEWQAGGFYRKQGYTEFGRIDDFVGGFWLSMMKKKL